MKKNNSKKNWKKTHRQRKEMRMVTLVLSLDLETQEYVSELACRWGIKKEKVVSRVIREIMKANPELVEKMKSEQ